MLFYIIFRLYRVGVLPHAGVSPKPAERSLCSEVCLIYYNDGNYVVGGMHH